MSEWPPFTKPFRTSPPEGAVGIVLPIRDDLRFFKLAYHSILAFTDYRFMLTVVDNMSGIQTRQYLESIRRNHNINVLQYQSDHNLAAEWNLGLRFMFSFSSVKYGAVLTPTVVVDPFWLSGLVRAVGSNAGVSPASNVGPDQVLLLKRETYETFGGFDESKAEPAAFLAKLIESKKTVPEVPAVCIHKFRINGFDPRREEVERPTRQEKQEAVR